MITCKEAGPLMEQEEFEKLSFFKRVGLRFHLFICKCCKGYQKDSQHIHKIVKAADPKFNDSSLTEQEKAEIKAQLSSN